MHGDRGSCFRASYETALFLGFRDTIKFLKGKDKGQAHWVYFESSYCVGPVTEED